MIVLRRKLIAHSLQGEISALINLSRTLGGFSVAYFQIPWAEKHGALQTFGVEAACVPVLDLDLSKLTY